MAYQNVGTPRFYISWGDWWATMGTNPNAPTYHVHPNHTLNPSVSHTHYISGGAYASTKTSYPVHVSVPVGINFVAILNHDLFGEYEFRCKQQARINCGAGGMECVEGDDYLFNIQEDFPTLYWWSSYTNLIGGEVWATAEYKGFSIGTFEDYPFGRNFYQEALDAGLPVEGMYSWMTTGVNTPNSVKVEETTLAATIGCFVFGRFYDMPHSSELNLTMSREMDGVKKIRTKGGSDLVKHSYIKPPLWGSLAPWELSDGYDLDQTLSRVGRRNWSLSFNYLQDSDVFPDVSSLNNYEALGYSSSNTGTEFTNTLFDDDSFFGSVIHRTNGGQLPFIFQPDKNNGNDFAICKFDQSSFQFNQVANGVYNVKLKIREVW